MLEPALAPEKGGDPRSGEDRRSPPSPSGRIKKEAPERPHERQPALGHEG